MSLFDIFKRKNANIKNIADDNLSINVLSDKDKIISKIGVDKIKIFCNKFLLKVDDLSIDFLKKIETNSDALLYLSDGNLSFSSVNKIINGTYSLSDVPNDGYDILKYYYLFNNEDKEKLLLLNRDVNVSLNNYVMVEMDDLNVDNLRLNKEQNVTIDSYFDGINIKKEDKYVLPVRVNTVYSDLNVGVLFPVNNIYFDNGDFSYFIDNEVKIDDKMIVIVDFDKFIKLTKDEMDAFGECKFVIREDINKYVELYNKISSKNLDISHNENNIDDNIIKVNHLLFVIDNCNMDDNKKQNFRYWISKYYNDGLYEDLEYISFKVNRYVDVNEVKKISLLFDSLSYEEKIKSIDKVCYNASIFMEEISNISVVSAFDIIKKIDRLNETERKIVLDDERIRNILADKIFMECSNDVYPYFDKLKSKLSVMEILHLFDVNLLKKYFVGNKKYDEYKVFASLCMDKKSMIDVINYALVNDEFFVEFFNSCTYFYSLFVCLEGELLKEVLYKLKDKGMYTKCHEFISSLSFETQKYLIDEKLDDDMISSIVPLFNVCAINYFFENDKRADYLFTKFNIVSMVRDGVVFGDNVLKNDIFFDALKSHSFVDFRKNIDSVSLNNSSEFIDKKLKRYYKQLFDSYDKDSDMFKIYMEIINNPESFRKYSPDYILDDEAILIFHKIGSVDNSVIINEFKKLTSKKISEIVVDALFSDNYYNVCANVREMFRFNGKLSDGDRVLDSVKEEFYDMILNFDKVSCADKISLYNKLKDKNVCSMFYDDLRELKNKSYDMIKNELFSLEDNSLDSYLSNKYGVDIYDARDKDFFMLVRSESNHLDEISLRRNCYSIISNENSSVFRDGQANIYGYNSFLKESVLHMFEKDSFSSSDINSSTDRVNRIMTANEIANGSFWYSEIQLVNSKKDDDVYYSKKPDFIVVYDDIDDRSIAESKKRNIPIVIIKRKELDKDKLVDIKIDANAPCDYGGSEIYIENSYDEQKFGKRNR